MLPQRRLRLITGHVVAPVQHDIRRPLSTTETCGIMAYVGNGEAYQYLLDGLKILENRGYDSAGISTARNGQLHTTKFASSLTTSDAIARVGREANVHVGGSVGIAHTRWATHGGKTDQNAHPHHDQYDRVSMIHNGVIENANELKKELVSKGVGFRSETDSEVIVHLVGERVHRGESLYDAVRTVTADLQGTWGLVFLDAQSPHQLVAAKNGSPLLIGIGQGRMFVASEPIAFSMHTKEFIALEDGEVALINADSHNLDVSRLELAPNDKVELSPAPFEHWTIKEIMDQPAAISASLNYGGRIMGDEEVKLGGLEQSRESLLGVSHLIIAACGTSLHAGMFGSILMRSLGSFETVQPIDAAEFQRETLPKRNAGLCVLSQSGETKDVHRVLVAAIDAGVPCFSIVNVVRSLIARTTKCGVYLNAGRENAVASTKAFTCQAAVLSLVAVWFSCMNDPAKRNQRRALIDALHRLPTNIGMSIHRLRSVCKSVASRLVDKQHMFILGKGLADPIAREGALKIKEITYIHAEGYSGGALKHGPFALLTDGTPVILIILDDAHEQFMRTACQEVSARNAFTVVISNKRMDVGDAKIEIPSNGPLTALLAVIPLQLIAYEIAVLKGFNPDRPRHLAKAVTTD